MLISGGAFNDVNRIQNIGKMYVITAKAINVKMNMEMKLGKYFKNNFVKIVNKVRNAFHWVNRKDKCNFKYFDI